MTTNGRDGSSQAITPLERFIGASPGPLGIGLSIVFVIVVGIFDHLTGLGVSLAPFYLCSTSVVVSRRKPRSPTTSGIRTT
jgi:hypothetical protein